MIEDNDLEQRLAESLEAEKRRVFREWAVDLEDDADSSVVDPVD